MVQIGRNSFRPFDYAQVLRDVEDIQGARVNREVQENALTRQNNMEEARRGHSTAAERAFKEAGRAQRGGGGGARGAAAGNDPLGLFN